LNWVLSDAWRAHLHERVPRLAPTHLERSGTLYKLPPLHLLIDFDRCCFVGATNGQLHNRMEQAFLERGHRRWKRIELHFLDNDGLNRIATADRPWDLLKRERDLALQQLEASLPDWADSWAFWEQNDSTLFASIWQRDDGRGQQVHVHLSARVWGQDIRFSPATDYRSTTANLAGDPEIRTTLAGVAHLALVGRLLRSGH
jgi:hypothetical protein